MASYKISITVNGNNITTIRKQVLAAFGQDISAQVEKIERATSRNERLSDAEGFVEDAKNTVIELKEEMEEWLSNMPESLKGGFKADEVQEAIDSLETLEQELDDVDFGIVSFPGMF